MNETDNITLLKIKADGSEAVAALQETAAALKATVGAAQDANQQLAGQAGQAGGAGDAGGRVQEIREQQAALAELAAAEKDYTGGLVAEAKENEKAGKGRDQAAGGAHKLAQALSMVDPRLGEIARGLHNVEEASAFLTSESGISTAAWVAGFAAIAAVANELVQHLREINRQFDEFMKGQQKIAELASERFGRVSGVAAAAGLPPEANPTISRVGAMLEAMGFGEEASLRAGTVAFAAQDKWDIYEQDLAAIAAGYQTGKLSSGIEGGTEKERTASLGKVRKELEKHREAFGNAAMQIIGERRRSVSGALEGTPRSEIEKQLKAVRPELSGDRLSEAVDAVIARTKNETYVAPGFGNAMQRLIGVSPIGPMLGVEVPEAGLIRAAAPVAASMKVQAEYMAERARTPSPPSPPPPPPPPAAQPALPTTTVHQSFNGPVFFSGRRPQGKNRVRGL